MTYTYDGNGNITSVKLGDKTTTYVYDSQNQLIRENNQEADKTWVWTYDAAGNITSKKEYAYSTGVLGTATDTVTYGYDTAWGDKLISYDGTTISYDAIGNPLSDGTWFYTWEQGRQLVTMSCGQNIWNFTYDESGMRTGRSNTGTVYTYTYNGSQLSRMDYEGIVMYFTYGADGTPLTINYNGTAYYYVTNLQGDVVGILDSTGAQVVGYTYDAWGRLLTTTDTMANTLGLHNPLRYRGYVYDRETGLYYLQSRYYNPSWGRFINADAQLATGDFTGLNLFAYCNNNPTNYLDKHGTDSSTAVATFAGSMWWLCFLDGPLPICDILYAIGIGGTLLLASALLTGSTANTNQSSTASTDSLQNASEVQSAKKPVNLPSWKKLQVDMDHISSGHMPGGPRNPDGKKTVFWGLTAEEVYRAIQEAYNSSSKLMTQGERILVEGYSEICGQIIEIWVNVVEKIIETAYPKG